MAKVQRRSIAGKIRTRTVLLIQISCDPWIASRTPEDRNSLRGVRGKRVPGNTELERMVEAGMTPAQVIVAATSAAARVLRLDDMGTLTAGKSADFLVLDANPLDNIVNTPRISAVYLRGAALDRVALRARWTAVPSPSK